jgi:tetratricopeptide (TPR) repeat protein
VGKVLGSTAVKTENYCKLTKCIRKMDIDEFLDREVQSGKKEDIEDVSSQSAEETIEEPAANDVTEEGVGNAGTGKAEEKDTIKHYFQLWDKVLEAKFKWDDKLYEELEKEGSGVKEDLDKSLLTAGRQKKAIKRLIGKTIAELEHKNYEAATKLYSEISNMRNKLPEFFLEERKELNMEIFLLYEKLHDKIDLRFINDFKESIAKVRNLIKDSASRFYVGDMEKAKIFYESALGIYKSLPNGFLSEKIELGNGLLKLYKDLSVQTQIKELQQQLSKEARGSYRYTSSENKLMHLSETFEKRNLEREQTGERHSIHSKSLLSNLIARRLDRARVNLKRGLYSEAKKNIEAILKVDSNNIEAKQMLSSIPA